MCNIFILEPGQMPGYHEFENCVYNNWHSYGLVTKVGDRLDIKKVVPESGEVDPKEVYELLSKDIEHQRFLHLRHTTAGKTDLENAHPFDVYYDPSSGRQILFMHNGTFDTYKSKKYNGTVSVDDDSGPSDTKNFVDQVLIPFIPAMNFGTGKGDIHHELFKRFMIRFWPDWNSKGVLIASDQPFATIGPWKELDNIGAGGPDKIKVSNDLYFDHVQRGPEFTRRRLREEEDKKNAKKNAPKIDKKIVQLSEFDLSRRHSFYDLPTSPCHLVNDFDFYDRQGAVAVGYLSPSEIAELYEYKEEMISVADWVFTDYALLYEEFQALEEKLQKSTKKNAEFAERIKELTEEKTRTKTKTEKRAA